MNLKKVILVIVSLSFLAAFAGCKKKPRRPNPLDTVIGDMPSESQSGFGQLRGGDVTFENPGESLTTRGSGSDMENAIEGLLPTVYFDTDSSTVKPSERAKLNQAATYLQNNSSARLVLEGHCDWRNTTEYNLALGDRRANSVKRYVETLGISGNRLEILSKGDLEAVEGASAAQMAQDRRVQLKVLR